MCCCFKEFEGKPKINYVTVFERPGLREFLKQVSIFADLILFTAGLEGLSLMIIVPFIDRHVVYWLILTYILPQKEGKKDSFFLHSYNNF